MSVSVVTESVANLVRITEALAKKYPNHSWDMVRFLSGAQARQKQMERVVKSIFPVIISLALNVRFIHSSPSKLE